MNAYAIGAALGLLAGLAYGYRAWRSAARRLAAIQEEFKTPAPAASTPRAPGPEPRLLMSSRFYSDGVVYVDDHIKHRTTRFNPPPCDDPGITDEDIERFLSDGV